MDLTPILHAAIRATGGDPEAEEFDAVDIERAQRALRAVDAQLDRALGYTHLATVSFTGEVGKGRISAGGADGLG